MNASGRSTVGGSSGLRSQVEKLGLVIRDHDLQLEQDRRAVAALEDDKERVKAVIQAQDEMINSRITSEVQAVRDEMNHKFSLQVAENKRLQAQLQKQSSDMSKMLRLLEGMNSRINQLEAEVGLTS